MKHKPLYEIFDGEELKIAEKIQQRRLQMLVHSYIYYDLNDNIISDNDWSKWAEELQQLQNKYPNIADAVPYGDGFENWDASTGAFLPYRCEKIVNIAHKLLDSVKCNSRVEPTTTSTKSTTTSITTSKQIKRTKLF